jgi:hypothetical protein
LNAEQQTRLRQLLKQPLDCDYLLSIASTHGLIPLLHKHLNLAKSESILNSQNVLHLVGKQLKLFHLFRENSIPTAIFKGSALAQAAYGDFSLRQAGDIDVLISRRDFHRAKLLLESLGYQTWPHLTAAQLNSHLASNCEIQFVRDDWFTIVDLHWALAPKSFVFKMETDELLSRLQPVAIAGTEIQTLATEDLIVYLSMHGAKHLWRALEWISSLAELLRAAESIAWDTVVERAENAHTTRMLALGLRLAQNLSNVEIPAAVWRAVDRDESSKRMAQQTLAEIFDDATFAASTETNLYNLKIMDRKRDALVSALRALFVPTLADWSTLNLPPSLHSLYYAYRPLRLSKVYSSALWRKLAARGAA